VTYANGGVWTESIIYSFTQGTGRPAAGPIIGASGVVYGTTYSGGRSRNCYEGCGTVFELNPIGGGWKTSNLYSFQGGGNGYSPASVLVLDRRGTLYGTLSRGDNGGGVIFELQEEGGRWRERPVYNFWTVNNCADGATPVGLILDKNGTLYGTTEEGGIASCGYNDHGGCGTVFKLTHWKGKWRLGEKKLTAESLPSASND